MIQVAFSGLEFWYNPGDGVVYGHKEDTELDTGLWRKLRPEHTMYGRDLSYL